MTAYPTSAQLRALRASLMSAPSLIAEHPDAEHLRAWREPNGWRSHPPAYGADLIRSAAWTDERAHGIGARDRDVIPCRESHVGGMRCAVEAGDRASRARREASAMRRRAYVLRYGTWEYKAGVERDRPDVRVDDWTHWVSSAEATADHQAYQPRYR